MKCGSCQAEFDDIDTKAKGYRFQLTFVGYNEKGESHLRDIRQNVCSKSCLKDYIESVAKDLP